jgi:hypothetical protein
MRILITGGTGLIGRQLCKSLLKEGHELTVLSRYPASVAKKCGETVHSFETLAAWRSDIHFDAVINLAGEPIVDAPWTESRKRKLWNSRVTLTQALVQCISQAQQKPSVFLSGSAIGFYGNRGDVLLDENEPAGNDFAARLCQAWESAAFEAENQGLRVCVMRTGLVLSQQGGLLGRMALPFKLGLGARLGDGQQWMSWVHMDDYVEMVLRLLRDVELKGVFNLTAPNPVMNTQFTQILAKAVHRPALFVAPAWLLKLAMGERVSLLLEGQRVSPKRMQDLGYQFEYSQLEDALQHVLG